MMIDENVVAASPSTVYRVLERAGRISRWNRKPSKKGTGFVQPLAPHEHWHIDISYLNIASTRDFYLCSVLDEASRAILHWDLRDGKNESLTSSSSSKARESGTPASSRGSSATTVLSSSPVTSRSTHPPDRHYACPAHA